MKKLLSIALVLILALSLSVTAFAKGSHTNESIQVDENGVSWTNYNSNCAYYVVSVKTAVNSALNNHDIAAHIETSSAGNYCNIYNDFASMPIDAAPEGDYIICLWELNEEDGEITKTTFTYHYTPATSGSSITPATPDPKTGNTNVELTVAPTYTVTIPASITVENVEGSYTGTADITADGVILGKGENVVVTIDNSCDFTLTSAEGAELAYTVNGLNAEATDKTVATFVTKAEAQTVALNVVAGNPEFAGEYSGTVTFNVAVNASSVATVS